MHALQLASRICTTGCHKAAANAAPCCLALRPVREDSND